MPPSSCFSSSFKASTSLSSSAPHVFAGVVFHLSLPGKRSWFGYFAALWAFSVESHAIDFCLRFGSFTAGYAFVYFEDKRDAEDAIRSLDNTPFGYDRRRLSVEWSRVC